MKVAPKLLGYMLLSLAVLTATIGMGCICLLLPRAESNRSAFGYLALGIVLLWLTFGIVHRGLDIIYQSSGASAPVHSDSRPVAMLPLPAAPVRPVRPLIPSGFAS